jgi:hypothetical protein
LEIIVSARIPSNFALAADRPTIEVLHERVDQEMTSKRMSNILRSRDGRVSSAQVRAAMHFLSPNYYNGKAFSLNERCVAVAALACHGSLTPDQQYKLLKHSIKDCGRVLNLSQATVKKMAYYTGRAENINIEQGMTLDQRRKLQSALYKLAVTVTGPAAVDYGLAQGRAGNDIADLIT